MASYYSWTITFLKLFLKGPRSFAGEDLSSSRKSYVGDGHDGSFRSEFLPRSEFNGNDRKKYARNYGRKSFQAAFNVLKEMDNTGKISGRSRCSKSIRNKERYNEEDDYDKEWLLKRMKVIITYL